MLPELGLLECQSWEGGLSNGAVTAVLLKRPRPTWTAVSSEHHMTELEAKCFILWHPPLPATHTYIKFREPLDS